MIDRTCDLCEQPAKQAEDVQNEETGEIATAYLCEDHVETLEAYNRGEDVEF